MAAQAAPAKYRLVAGTWNLPTSRQEITKARNRKLTFRTTEPSSVSFDLDGRNAEALLITELVTDLWVYRQDAPVPGVAPPPAETLFRGRFGPDQDEIDENQHTSSFTATDYRDWLNRQVLFDADTLTYTAQDISTIAVSLINTITGAGHPGLHPVFSVAGVPATGNVQTVTFEPGVSVADDLNTITALSPGANWDIDPTLALMIWPGPAGRGVNNGIWYTYPGNVRTFTRTLDTSTYGTDIRINGQATTDTGATTPARKTAVDIATRPEGRFDINIGATDVTVQAQLNALADQALTDHQVILPTYSLTLRPGVWQGPDQVWLGDTVRTRLSSGRLQVDFMYRVQQIEVALSDEGDERDVVITVGGAANDLLRRIRHMAAQLRELERR